MPVLNRRPPYAYSKMEHEDPEETKHRRAQFLIYKTMQKAGGGSRRRRASWLGVRMGKLKIRFVGRLKKLRKGALLLFSAKPHFCSQICCVFRSCKPLLWKQEAKARTLPPIF